jgi:phospholipid/cholesterol/gamma-HCH transport system substrate-binding protein
MQSEKKTTFSVGLFVLVGLISLAWMILRLSDYGYTKDSYVVKVLFNYANGVVEGAPVHYAGVEVGKVDSVHLHQTEDIKVELDLRILSGTKIRNDSIVKINSSGLVGEKYVDIFPRSSSAEFVQHNEILKGEEPIPFSEMVSRAKLLVTKIEDYLNKATTEENRRMIEETIQNAHKISNNLVKIAEKVKLVIEENKDNFKSTVKDIKDSSHSMKEIFTTNEEAINETIKDINRSFSTLKGSLEKLDSAMEKLKSGEGTVGKLVQSEELYTHLKNLITDLEENPWKLLKKTKKKKKKEK